eukprot:Opistho-2@39464
MASCPVVRFDAVVVGAGVMGSSTALHLARGGTKTALIEQYALGHGSGSSHGPSRITRHLYKQPHYTEMMFEAFRLWEELERESGERVYTRAASWLGLHVTAECTMWRMRHAATTWSINV